MPIIPSNPPNLTQGGANNTGLTSTTSGVSSGVSGYLPDIATLIVEAGQRANVDTTTADGMRSAKLSLDFISMDLANYGLNLWTMDDQTLPLTQGVYNYQLSPDTIDILQNPVIRTTNGGYQQDIGISLVDYNTYENIVNKLEQGRPNLCYVQRTATPQIWLWLVPDGNGPYTLYYWRLRRMFNTGYHTNLMDVPFRFLEAITAGLAWRMAIKKKGPKSFLDLQFINLLKAAYDESFRAARNEDHSRADLHITPLSGFGYF
jgi:hypothetical protein